MAQQELFLGDGEQVMGNRWCPLSPVACSLSPHYIANLNPKIARRPGDGYPSTSSYRSFRRFSSFTNGVRRPARSCTFASTVVYAPGGGGIEVRDVKRGGRAQG